MSHIELLTSVGISSIIIVPYVMEHLSVQCHYCKGGAVSHFEFRIRRQPSLSTDTLTHFASREWVHEKMLAGVGGRRKPVNINVAVTWQLNSCFCILARKQSIQH